MVGLWLYATPAHAIRDVLHASNYLTITEGPGRFGSIVRPAGGHVDGHASLLISLQQAQTVAAAHLSGNWKGKIRVRTPEVKF